MGLTRAITCGVLSTAVLSAVAKAQTPTPAWALHGAGNGAETGYGVATDALGNVFLAGATNGSVAAPNAGLEDAFLSKYTAAGALLWSRQLGTAGTDHAWAVAADPAGNSYITGFSSGGLGGTSAGNNDMFLAKYDPTGTQVWKRQLGSTGSDYGRALTVDATGNVFVAGDTEGTMPGGASSGSRDAFVIKYDTSGNRIWTRQFGTSSGESGEDVALDSLGNIIVSGETGGNLGGLSGTGGDAFVRKFDANGNALWTRQVGTNSRELGGGVATDAAGNVYLAGNADIGIINPSPNQDINAFLVKYDAAGAEQWRRELDVGTDETTHDLAVDPAGNAWVFGTNLTTHLGSHWYHGFLGWYDTAGNLRWSSTIGTNAMDEGHGIALSPDATRVFVAGLTSGNWPGASNSNVGIDAFLAAYNVPEPAAAALVMPAIVLALRRRRQLQRGQL